MSVQTDGRRREQRSVVSRFTRLGATASALAIALASLTVPAAQAIQPGEWTLETQFGAGGFSFPYGVAVDQSNGSFFVSDLTGAGIFKFNSRGELLAKRVGSGQGKGNFQAPTGIALDDSGNLYVADAQNNLIQKFDKDLNWVDQWGSLGNGNGEFSLPIDVSVDSSGNVYVVDALNNRIQKFTGDGTYLGKWGTQGQGDGQFDQPNAVTVSPGGVVLVADTKNSRISAFTGTGVFQGSFGSSGNGPGEFEIPADVDIDESGNILVLDSGNGRVQKFNGAGTPITQWDVPTGSTSMALGSASGRAYVVDGSTAVFSYREASGSVFTTGLQPNGTVGKVYTSKLKASGFPTSTFSVLGDSLPKGLELTGDTVSGVKRKAGTYQVTLQADNGVGGPVTKEYAVTISKASSVLKTGWSTKYPKVKKTKIVAKLRISAPGTTGLSRTGTMKIYYGSKRVKTVAVHTSDHGVVSVKLPAFTKKGKKKITVRYFGNSQLRSSKYVTYVAAK